MTNIRSAIRYNSVVFGLSYISDYLLNYFVSHQFNDLILDVTAKVMHFGFLSLDSS